MLHISRDYLDDLMVRMASSQYRHRGKQPYSGRNQKHTYRQLLTSRYGYARNV